MSISSARNKQKHFHNFLFPSFLSSFILFVSIIFVLSICSILKAQTSTIAQKPFGYKVFMQKDTFLVGELVDVGVNLINISNITQKSGYVKIKMFDSNGNALFCKEESGDAFSPMHIELKPNDEAYRVIQLNWDFGITPNDHSHSFFKKGIYTIKVYFSAFDKSEGDSLNRVITIIEPEGDEAFVHNSWLEIERRAPFVPQKNVIELEQLLEAHPNSIYAPYILSRISMTYRIMLDDNSKEEKIAKKMLEDYAWSSAVLFKLNNSLIDVIPDKAERRGFLKKLLQETGNSPMKKQIELRLKAEMEE